MAVFTTIGAWATIALGNLGLSLTAAMAVGGAVANLAIGAALMGVSALLGGIGSQRPTTPTPQAQAVLNQSAGQRIRGYGKARLGGTRAFWDSRSGVLYQLIMAHHGRISAFEQFYVGDIAVTMDELGYVLNDPVRPHVRIFPQYGLDDQIAHDGLTGAWSDIWTADHRLRGIANWLVMFSSPEADAFQTTFPDSYNTEVTCTCWLSPVFDPRDGSYGWSENAGVCILDYLTHPDGYRLSMDDIDVQSFKDFADLCDEDVPLAAGGTEKRYRLWGVYGLGDDPAGVIAKMKATCDAEFYQTPEGKLAIRGGKWEAPTVTIRDSDIISHNMEEGNNKFAAFNSIQLTYTSPQHDFQTIEATSWINLAAQLRDGEKWTELSLDMVPSPSQARRLAKIHEAKANPRWKGTIVTNAVGLNALGERTNRIILPELEIDDAFFVAGLTPRPDLTGVEISVMSISEAAYSWTTAEEGQAQAIPEDTAPDLTFPVPDITLTGSIAGITATAVDPGRSDLVLEAQIRLGAGGLWLPMSTDGIQAGFGPSEVGDYQARARWRGPLETAGGWSFPYAEITV